MRGARRLSVGLALLLLGLAPHVLSSYLLALLTQAVISAMLAMSLICSWATRGWRRSVMRPIWGSGPIAWVS